MHRVFHLVFRDSKLHVVEATISLASDRERSGSRFFASIYDHVGDTNYSRVYLVGLGSPQRLLSDLLATRLNHSVDDGGEAATGAPVPGGTFLL